MAALPHAYHYLESSTLNNVSSALDLRLATHTPEVGGARHPHLYEGRFIKPRQAATLLSAVQVLVASRFFTPANSVAKAIALADPVITVDEERLRFEGFSSCCSAYIRVDFLPEGLEGKTLAKGTTNVDFTEGTRAALARVRDADDLQLSIGREAIELNSTRDTAIERKVDLPLRWLRGMVEVQSYMAAMDKAIETSAMETIRWFKHLPKNSSHHVPLWLAQRAGRLVTSTQPATTGIRITNTKRLRVLEPLLPLARQVCVYTSSNQQASAWVLQLDGARLTLALSAEPWRGFSGEGKALRALIHMTDHPGLPLLRAQLHWQSVLNPAALASQTGLTEAQVQEGLQALGASGLLGFDLTEKAYFHRALPYDLSRITEMHPRLADAQQLLEKELVKLMQKAPVIAKVGEADASHTVRNLAGQWRCTCPWFGKHQGERGPCKHVLAVEAALAREAGD